MTTNSNLPEPGEINQPLSEKSYEAMITRLGDYVNRMRPHSLNGMENQVKTENNDPNFSETESFFESLKRRQNRYQNPTLIGQGGMKRIYEVTDQMMNRKVALAVINNLHGTEIIEQFIKEAQITAQLEHSNIMPIYDIGLDDSGEPFFTMKLIRGESLWEIINKLANHDPTTMKLYPLERLLDIFVMICNAVAYAHTKGILHLDLKPDNIQIGDFGEVLVCDWGLSRFRLSHNYQNSDKKHALKSRITYLSKIQGTPGYMSPEQIIYTREKLTQSSDIYSLGAILYEILTLYIPIEKGDVEEMLQQTIEGTIIPPSQRVSYPLPSALESVCLHALELDPQRRYPTAQALVDDIQKYIHGYATSVEKLSFFGNIVLLCKRHKGASLVFVTSSIILVLIISVFIIQLRQSELEAREALHAKELAEQQQKEIEKETFELRMNEVISQYSQYSFDKAIESIKKIVSLNSNNWGFQKVKAFIHLGEQQFSEAAKVFKEINQLNFQFYQKFAEKKGKEKTPLNHTELLELIRHLHQDNMIATLNHLLINQTHDMTLDEKFDLIKEVLVIQNPQISINSLKIDHRLSTNPDRLFVSLAGNEQLSNITALSILSIHSLNLSNTRVHNISVLKKMPLKELNLSSTQVSDLSPLAEIQTLEDLDLSNSKVISISPLEETFLISLNLSGLEIEDVRVLCKMKNLYEVTLSESTFVKEQFEFFSLPSYIRIIPEQKKSTATSIR